MEIHSKYGSEAVQQIALGYRAVPQNRVAGDQATFAQSAALDQALRSLPDVRPSEVQRAKELARSVSYPPVEGIRQLAQLLAMKLSQAEGDSSS